jgi:hypothetical protein
MSMHAGLSEEEKSMIQSRLATINDEGVLQLTSQKVDPSFPIRRWN